MKRSRLPLTASVCLILVLMSSCLLGSADAKKKKYVGETGGDFEFIDELASWSACDAVAGPVELQSNMTAANVNADAKPKTTKLKKKKKKTNSQSGNSQLHIAETCNFPTNIFS
ncbi:hypothetical protein AWZ03_004075 [Drosophila navojoa]|uniref:Pleiotrophin/Midkine C-terminal domain-containing protein n=1 Tax=Drosophila navojoa TaxID=7232 RepID=A0A484BLN1_DRONA|nr:hypothetical protein AWZ03_004075 [Drosophila navojoa]